MDDSLLACIDEEFDFNFEDLGTSKRDKFKMVKNAITIMLVLIIYSVIIMLIFTELLVAI